MPLTATFMTWSSCLASWSQPRCQFPASGQLSPAIQDPLFRLPMIKDVNPFAVHPSSATPILFRPLPELLATVRVHSCLHDPSAWMTAS